MTAFDAVHFLRPQWLWLLLALPLLVWAWQARRRADNAWRDSVDPHLLPHLVETGPGRRGIAALSALLLGGALVVLALAGPAWRQAAQPLQGANVPLVLALDLSSSIEAGDLPPSRLLQVRAKLAALLAQRSGGQVAMLAYADDAFTVAPLTDDVRNVALYLDALSPTVMPVDGSRGDRAIAQATRLLRQAGASSGQILLVSDHADGDAVQEAASARRAGYTVSALGVGTPAGAPHPAGDGLARLDAASLQALARAGGGRYHAMTADPADLRALDVLDPQAGGNASPATSESGARSWRDEGYWLLLPLLALGLLAFRRGAVVAVLVLAAGLSLQPAHAQASRPTPAPDTMAADDAPRGTLWRRADQAAHRQLEQGNAAYRGGRYDEAVQRWRGVPGADAAYNRGNALAKAGRYDEAIRAYDEALSLQPGMEDAIANRQAVEAAKARKPPPGNAGQDSRGQPQPGDDTSGGAPGDSGEGAPSQAPPSQSPPPQSGQPAPEPPRGEPGQPDADDAGSEPGTPAGQQDQQAADAELRAQIQRALDAGQAGAEPGSEGAEATDAPSETAAERERREANAATLRRLPDDPGGLLRAKFRLQHERRQGAQP
ncbi:VWA domain-containing protein [Luteimonas sp. BDR2-5]|uniref:tetratricopeptide repeat protein n=1 Tax=Proluteimonas luteida TaxID=2878685 RepID=UPI001E4A8518|nr:VWA domain-containing protein [Luteimonas sp. BDR2-5]MCD9026998.1 VWA domain-containing protein [Luteimonas sp. BDR2-5]